MTAVSDNLLFHCSLAAQHVSSDIISHYQELLNCNYSFWFYSRLSLPAFVMALLFKKLGVSSLSLHVLLNQMAAFVSYSFRLMFLYACTSLAC
jgi:hypothetical protein